jgi:hypothetical protein
MNTENTKELKQWILKIASYLSRGEAPPAQCYATFIQEPALAFALVEFIDGLDEAEMDAKHAYYAAAVFASTFMFPNYKFLLKAVVKALKKFYSS